MVSAARPPRIQRLLTERVALANRPAPCEHGNVVTFIAARPPPAKSLGAYFGCDKVNVLNGQKRVLTVGGLGNDECAAHALGRSWFAPFVQELAEVGASRLLERYEADRAHALDACGARGDVTVLPAVADQPIAPVNCS